MAVAECVSVPLGRAANALNRIGSLDEAVVTFDNTVGALDDLRSAVLNVSNRLFLMGQTSTDPALRDAQFPITDGRRLSNGKDRRPVVALVCNSPPPSEGSAFAAVAP